MSEYRQYKVAFTCGQFDIIHPGYINLFQECKAFASKVIVGLNIAPENKPPSIFSISDRIHTLNSIKYIDAVIPYKGEDSLARLLSNLVAAYGYADIIRLVGYEYKNVDEFTGDNLTPIHYRNSKNEWRYSQVIETCYEKFSENPGRYTSIQ